MPDKHRDALARSISIFQLGESGGGTRLRRYTRSIATLENLRGYQRAVDLFVAEEQSHAALLARTVLSSWNINTTEDFGRLVFSLIDLGILRRNDDDCFEDFIDVYGFNESFADLAALASHGD